MKRCYLFVSRQLLLAPRNKKDFLAVRDLLSKKGLQAAYRSEPCPEDSNQDIFLLDTFGELDRFYELAEIALVGKSWGSSHRGGGHNPFEPAARGKPVLFGPHTYNYTYLTKKFTATGGGLMVPNQAALAAALEDLLDNPDKAREMCRRAADFVWHNQGGVQKTMDLLRPFIESTKC